MRRLLLLAFAFVTSTSFGKDESCSLPHIITLYGVRGSGRAYIAARLRQDFSLPCISLTSLLSTHLLEETSLGKVAKEYDTSGEEIPQDISLSALIERLMQPDCQQGVFLDEFPYTIEQAQELERKIGTRFCLLAIAIDVNEDWLVQRVQNRLICRMCGRVYDELDSSSKKKESCDICSGTLQHRLDDSPEAIQKRLETHQSCLNPLFELYRNKQALLRVSGEQNTEDTYKDVVASIKAHTKLLQKLRPKKNKDRH